MDAHGPRSADDAGRPPAMPEALRIQIAAVAAQQIANDHEEIRLAEQRTVLDSEVAAHLEDKRRQLESLSARLQAERAALQRDRQVHQQQVERVSGDLSQPQRELLESEKEVRAERERLARLQRKLKHRWRRYWQQKQQDHRQRQQAQAHLAAMLARREVRVEAAERSLNERLLRHNSEVELARRQTHDAWTSLRQAQQRWKRRRALERAALRVRAHDVDMAVQNLEQQRAKLAQDQRAWQSQRQVLELELDGVNTRILNQRQILDQQEVQVRALAGQLGNQPATEKPPIVAPPEEGAVPQRVVDLDRQAQELADQRCELVEAWERVAHVHDAWHADHTQAVAELESMATRLLERDLIVQEREQACAHADEGLRRRHQELLRLQEQMIAWRARLHTDEDAWDSDKARVLAELRSKDAAAEQHLAMLAELRQRWATRRRHEMDKLEGERAALETARKEFARLRAELLKRAAALEDEQRVIAEKSQALEQYLEQTLSRAAGDPQAEHRLERLRREWIAQNAEAIRNLGRERATLHAELKAVEHRHEELHHRAVEITAAETELTEKQIAWEEQQLLLEAQRVRLECDLHSAQEQRLFAEQQLAAAREEVERMARALLDEPNPPLLSLNQAA